jgi:hypothetical protein
LLDYSCWVEIKIKSIIHRTKRNTDSKYSNL